MKFKTEQTLLMGAIIIVLIEAGFFLVISLTNPDHNTTLLAIGPGLGVLALTEIYSRRIARCREQTPMKELILGPQGEVQ